MVSSDNIFINESPNKRLSSSSCIISAFVLLAKISLLPLILFTEFKYLKMERKGVIPAPPAINIPSPL